MLVNPPLSEHDLSQLAARIRVLIVDVDGVMTDAKIYFLPDPSGKIIETKGFDSQDGIALHWARAHGIKTGLISSSPESPATAEGARQVGMSWVFQGHLEKTPLFDQIMAEAQITKEQVAYIGDDLTDVAIFRRVGLSLATANARPEVKGCAHAVTAAAGGAGAIREVIELLLKAQGAWDGLLKKYEVTL